jgi:putative hemin transport protein
MTRSREKPSPEAIRKARAENPGMRERDLAQSLSISEADLVAAHCGEGVIRIQPDVGKLLHGLEAVGEVMALTRNESAVHEKIGTYEKVTAGREHAIVLGEQIDLRIFPKAWAHGFAVEKRSEDGIRRSLQFFDAAGNAVHKVHLRPTSNLHAYQNLTAQLESADRSQTVVTVEAVISSAGEPASDGTAAHRDLLRDRWSRMTDVHQLFAILKKLKMTRHQAIRAVGEEYAWQLAPDSVGAMLRHAVSETLPIMCFVGNGGCVQIHSGPIHDVRPMGPWLNIMDPTFHLHLRTDHISEAWAVRKPSKDGNITSIEAYDANREMIIQFFGVRKEGSPEREDWRFLVENLPRIPQSSAA